jgi:hypothetical protein
VVLLSQVCVFFVPDAARTRREKATEAQAVLVE